MGDDSIEWRDDRAAAAVGDARHGEAVVPGGAREEAGDAWLEAASGAVGDGVASPGDEAAVVADCSRESGGSGGRVRGQGLRWGACREVLPVDWEIGKAWEGMRGRRGPCHVIGAGVGGRDDGHRGRSCLDVPGVPAWVPVPNLKVQWGDAAVAGAVAEIGPRRGGSRRKAPYS